MHEISVSPKRTLKALLEPAKNAKATRSRVPAVQRPDGGHLGDTKSRDHDEAVLVGGVGQERLVGEQSLPSTNESKRELVIIYYYPVGYSEGDPFSSESDLM